MSFYSIVQTPSDGTTAALSIPFPFISAEHIEVRIAGVLKVAVTDYNVVGSTVVPVSGHQAGVGVIVDIRRNSSRTTLLVDFTDGATLPEADLDLAAKQQFYISQEAFDAAAEVVVSASTAMLPVVTASTLTAALAALGLVTKRSTANQSVATTSMTTVTGLSIPILANEEWLVEWDLWVTGLFSNTGFKFLVDFPNGGTVNYDGEFRSTDAESTATWGGYGQTNTDFQALTLASTAVTGSKARVTFRAWVTNGATPGNIDLYVAETDSDATGFSVRRGSSVRATKIVT